MYLFASKGKKDPNWLFSCIVKFLQFQKAGVEKEEVTGATLRNFVKAIKLFCKMSDIPISWKKISRGLPKTKRYADDRTDISGCSKCNYFLCFVLLYVRRHNDLWMTYYESRD
jgi:hypothetical protein